MSTIVSLIEEKSSLTKKLENLVYGSIEIRGNGEKKFIYTHYRDEGVLRTKYAGVFSNELYNLILENNRLAKDLKKRLSAVNKELAECNYIETKIPEEVELNRAFAIRNIVDSVYKQAMLEGVATTYSDTETLLNGGKVTNMTANDINKVINLKHSWEFITNKGVLQYPSNYLLLCQINSLIEEGFSVTAGRLRTVPVTIGGSSYIPPFPIESAVKEQLEEILKMEDTVQRAIKSLLFIMRKQLFLDGNKRTAVLFANHILISHGKGLIVIPAEKVSEYKKKLVDYYETGNEKTIAKILIDYAYLPLT